MATIGEKLKALRVARGLSQRDVTEALGLADGHVSAIETGKIGNPRVDVAALLANYYGADLGELLREGATSTPGAESVAIVEMFEKHLTPGQRRLVLRWTTMLTEYWPGKDGELSESPSSQVERRKKASRQSQHGRQAPGRASAECI